MRATVNLPDALFQQLEIIAQGEGATPSDLIQRIVQAHVASHPSTVTGCGDTATLPLIPASETGSIQPISGADVDALLL